MGRHLDELLKRLFGPGDADVWEALNADTRDADWKNRPPTMDELKAHHAEHADEHGISRWLFREGRDGWRVYCFDTAVLSEPAQTVCPPKWSRPLSATGETCAWPKGSES